MIPHTQKHRVWHQNHVHSMSRSIVTNMALSRGIRASYKEFGHSHWWELIEIFVTKFGIWLSSLFPKWELIPPGIPTGRILLKSLFPNLGFGSPAYSQRNQSFSLTFKQDWELIEFNFHPLGIGWRFCSHLRLGIDWIAFSHIGNWLKLLFPFLRID